VYTLNSGLTDSYSTLAEGRWCSLRSSSISHAWLHPWSYQPVIPLQAIEIASTGATVE